jgi:hypothetical protein
MPLAAYSSFTLARLNKVTPIRGISPHFPYYDHHRRKRLAAALSGAFSAYIIGFSREFTAPPRTASGCKIRTAQPKAWFFG